MRPIVQFQNGVKRYGQFPAVDGLTLDIPAGESCALMGVLFFQLTELATQSTASSSAATAEGVLS